MKTDLTKILSVAGQHGLFAYVAQARNGAVVAALSDKKRSIFDARSRITALSDISIYTAEGEVKLREVFLRMKDALGGQAAPGSKSSSDEIRKLFEKALPTYDADRFYLSHMKKVVDWYNELLQFASLDFTDPEEEETEKPAE